MNRTSSAARLAAFAALCLGMGLAAQAQTPAAGQDAGAQKQPYTMAEYNSYQACGSDKNPATQVRCFDDFVSKYPNSALLVYIYPQYVQSYMQMKDYKKVLEFADKTVALDKIDGPTKYTVLSIRAQAYNALRQSDPKGAGSDPAIAKGAVDAVGQAFKYLEEVKKPDGMTDDQFAKEKDKIKTFLNGVGAEAAGVQKDYPKQIEFYKAVLATNPDEVVTNYQLGKVYLAMQPPQSMDAFWYVARGAASKAATQQQKKQLTDYLRKLIANYQQASCDSITDAELNELLQLAASTPARPDTYKIPSVDDLNAARKDMTIKSVFDTLKAGGDQAKVTWLAACGLEFPEVPGKVIEVTPSADSVVIKAAFVTSEEEFNSKTAPDMEVKIVGQPDAQHLEKDAAFHFTATIATYDPDPAFMIHWDKGKVKAEDIPAEKTPKKPAPRRPSRKPPNR
jgi:tetratricopeptide (TPR) repeat protein